MNAEIDLVDIYTDETNTYITYEIFVVVPREDTLSGWWELSGKYLPLYNMYR